jgi:Holliday junction resolvase RusA-like endonuclease
MTIELPYPPSVNHYWRHVGPRVLISREGRRFRDRVGAILAASQIVRLDGPLTVTINLYPPDNRRRDVDNAMKALLDSLQHGGAYIDDSQIVKLNIEKFAALPGGKTIVCIEERQ